MNVRKPVLAVVGGVVLAVPAAASAATSPAKHGVEKHAKAMFRRQGQPRQLYLYLPGPFVQVSAQSEQEFEQDYNEDLVAHGLDPIDFPSAGGTAAATP